MCCRFPNCHIFVSQLITQKMSIEPIHDYYMHEIEGAFEDWTLVEQDKRNRRKSLHSCKSTDSSYDHDAEMTEDKIEENLYLFENSLPPRRDSCSRIMSEAGVYKREKYQIDGIDDYISYCERQLDCDEIFTTSKTEFRYLCIRDVREDLVNSYDYFSDKCEIRGKLCKDAADVECVAICRVFCLLAPKHP